jgi:hypothetical protein
MKKHLFWVMLLASACSAPTEPTREVPVTDTSTHVDKVHLNLPVRLADGDVRFVCAYHGGTHRMLDGTVAKVSHMLSKTPCDVAGIGKF